MKLNFLGRGSAFNVKEGNTSAYFTEGNELFLIDCGENIFERIIKKDLLKDIKTINVFITHTHPDHIGSLGSLIFYSFLVLKSPVNIIIPRSSPHLHDILLLLDIWGCTKEMYKIVRDIVLDGKYSSFKSVRFNEVEHSKAIPSYSIVFNTENGAILYTGDTNDLEYIKHFFKLTRNIDVLYVDSTSLDYEDNPHLYIGLLKGIVPCYFRNKIYCMHINDDTCIELAESFGFNVVQVD